MRVNVCSVGSELVSGAVADGNARWLAQRLAETGCTVPAIVMVGDDADQLVDVLRWLADRSDVLVVGGGLGPTVDDVTRYAVARFAGLDLSRRPELVEHLERVYSRLARPMPADALRQADVPTTAEVHPPQGTAAGFSLDVAVESRRVRVHVLPGVPWEYRELAERAVLPDVARRSGGTARVTRTLHVAGLGESGVGDLLRPLSDRLAALKEVELGFLANDDEVLVKITATGADPKAARGRTEPIMHEAMERLGDALTSVDDATLADEVGRLLGVLDLSLATAETFTGGYVATSISSTAASALRCAFVAPTPDALLRLIEWGGASVDGAGAVRPDVVAAALARAVRRRTGADVAIATVGVLDEQDAMPEHPVGTAVWAIAGPDDAIDVDTRFVPAADRSVLQVRGAAFALESLRRRLRARHPSRTAEGVTP